MDPISKIQEITPLHGENTIVNQTSKADSYNRSGTFLQKYHSKLSSVIVTGAMVTH